MIYQQAWEIIPSSSVFRNPQLTAWHQSAEFQEMALAFHDTCGRTPPNDTLEPARRHFGQLSVQILQILRSNNLAMRMENQGSSYEGIKTRSSSLEFDCMVVLCGGDSLVVNDARCPRGFAKLQVKTALTTPDWLNRLKAAGSNDVDPRKVVDWFQGQLQMAINRLSSDIKLRRHGETAVQMDVPNCGTLWYSVDMVPGFAINDKSFVAKSKKTVPFTWRQSFAQVEKGKWKNIDSNNKCHKMVARMIKVIREIDDPMKPLQSYTVKTALMNLNRDRPHLSWSQNDLGKRFVDVLAYLRDCMTSRTMPHHYVGQGINVLEGYLSNPAHLTNMKNRLDRWLNSEPAMRELLTKKVPDVTYRASFGQESARVGGLTEVFPEDI